MEEKKLSPETILTFVNHFQKSRVILTAFELEIFTVLDSGAKTSAEVAKIINTDIRATDRLMNTACVLGYLTKENGIFQNTEDSGEFLVKGKPAYMAGLHHTLSLWHTWSTLTDSVRQGKAVYQRPSNVNDRDSHWLESFIGAMHYRGKKQAPALVAKVDLKGVKSVLDVGGGSGAFAMAFAQAGDDIRATVFDLPNVIPIAERYISQEGMEAKVDTVGGDYNTDDLPKGYDIVFLSAIVHANSYDENEKLIARCAAALNPGGRILIQDQVMDESRLQPPAGAMFALNMLVGTQSGDTYTENEIKDWFHKAGISYRGRIETFMGNAIVVGS